MIDAGSGANSFHEHRFSVNRSMSWREMFELAAVSFFALGVALHPNSTAWLFALLERFRSEDALPPWILGPVFRGIAAVAGTINVARLCVGWVRHQKDGAWPVWIDADAISTLDEAGIYTQTRWSELRLAQVMKSKDDYAPYELRLELHSKDVIVYPIPGVEDRPFHAALARYAGSRLSDKLGSVGDLPTSSIEMILRARELSKRVGDEYLLKCKGTTRSCAGNVLNADLPLTVSSEDERAFLQTHPALAEIETLILNAIRLEEQEPGPTSAYNAANACNQLGAHYVFVQDFDKAIESIGTALSRLDVLRASCPSNSAIVGEIATAHFNLGDVYTTLYRRSGSMGDRERALLHYHKSLELDRFLNADCSLTEVRLASLQRGDRQET